MRQTQYYLGHVWQFHTFIQCCGCHRMVIYLDGVARWSRDYSPDAL